MTTPSRHNSGRNDGPQDVVSGIKDILDNTDGVPVVDDRLQDFFGADDLVSRDSSGRKIFPADKPTSALDLPAMDAREIGARDTYGALPLPETPKPVSLGTNLFEPVQPPQSAPPNTPPNKAQNDRPSSEAIRPPVAPEPPIRTEPEQLRHIEENNVEHVADNASFSDEPSFSTETSFSDRASFEPVAPEWTDPSNDFSAPVEQLASPSPVETQAGFFDEEIPVEAPPSAFDNAPIEDGSNTIDLSARAVPLALQAKAVDESFEGNNFDAAGLEGGESSFDAVGFDDGAASFDAVGFDDGDVSLDALGSSIDDGQTVSVDGWSNGLPSIPGLDDLSFEEEIPDLPAGYGDPEFEPRLASLDAASAAAPLTGVYSDIENLRGPEDQAEFALGSAGGPALPIYQEEEASRGPLILGLLALAALLVGGGLAWAWQLSRSGDEAEGALTQAEVPAGPNTGIDSDGSTAEGAGGGDDGAGGGGVNGGELGASFGGLEQGDDPLLGDDPDDTSSTTDEIDEALVSPTIERPTLTLPTSATTRRTTTTARRTTTTARRTTTTRPTTTTTRRTTTTTRPTTSTTRRTTTTTRPTTTTTRRTTTTTRPTTTTTRPTTTTTRRTTTTRPTTTTTRPTTTQRPTIPTTPPPTQPPTTQQPTTTAPQPVTIGDRVYVNDFSGPGAAGVTVGLWRDVDGDEVGDTVVGVTTTDSNGRYSFSTQAGCYSVLFRASASIGDIDPNFEGRSTCLDAGESDFTLDSILLVAAPEPPTQCVVEPNFGDAVRILESDQRWADDYILYDSSGSELGRTSAIGSPIVVSSTEWRWVTPFNHRDVASVAAVISGSTSDRVTCRT